MANQFMTPKYITNNPYTVGDKVYGGGRSFPTSGPVDPMGYRERDAVIKARMNAIKRRQKRMKMQDYLSADYLRSI